MSIRFACTHTLETAEVFTSDPYSISPNPETNELKISGMVGQPVVRIVAMDGRLLHVQPYLGEISVCRLPGLYVLEVPSIGLRKWFLKELGKLFGKFIYQDGFELLSFSEGGIGWANFCMTRFPPIYFLKIMPDLLCPDRNLMWTFFQLR